MFEHDCFKVLLSWHCNCFNSKTVHIQLLYTIVYKLPCDSFQWSCLHCIHISSCTNTPLLHAIPVLRTTNLRLLNNTTVWFLQNSMQEQCTLPKILKYGILDIKGKSTEAEYEPPTSFSQLRRNIPRLQKIEELCLCKATPILEIIQFVGVQLSGNI